MRMLTTLLLLLIVSSLDTVKCGGAKRPSPPKSPTLPSPPKSPTLPSPPQSPTLPSPPQSPTTPSRQITLQKVAMVWPETWCRAPGSRCAKVVPSTFSLHGIWPSDSHGTSITNCKGPDFNETQLPLKKVLIKKYWLGFDDNYESKWRHEWDVHGKCSGLSLKDYFQKGVELSMSLTKKIDDAFSKQRPSNHYEAQSYLNAIVSYFNFQPQIRCAQYGHTETKYLKEIVFCYDVNLLQLTHCPGNAFAKECGNPDSAIYFT